MMFQSKNGTDQVDLPHQISVLYQKQNSKSRTNVKRNINLKMYHMINCFTEHSARWHTSARIYFFSVKGKTFDNFILFQFYE